MTNYKFTFTTKDGTIEIVKAFATYMQAMNFKAEYFAQNGDIFYATMQEI